MFVCGSREGGQGIQDCCVTIAICRVIKLVRRSLGSGLKGCGTRHLLLMFLLEKTNHALVSPELLRRRLFGVFIDIVYT